MASTITRDGYVFLRTAGSTETELSVQRTDSDTDNPLAQIKMFGSGKDDFQGVLSFETINSGSSDGPTEERMRIHTNGNVGIGATNPSEKLEVDGIVKATAFDGDGSHLTGISESKWSDAPGGDIYYGEGNVGIGTTTPKNRLDVEGGAVIGAGYSGTRTSPINGLLVQGNVGIGTLDPNAKLEVRGGAIMPSAGNSEQSGIMFPKNPGGGGSDAAWIRYYPRSGEATTFEIGTSNDRNDHIALMASGNVGIGTADPGDKLTISEGDLKVEGGRYRRLKLVSDSYWAGIELVAREKGEAGNPYIDFTHGELGSPNYGIRLYAPTNDKFVIQGGNVGIGTADPQDKLDMSSGSIRFCSGGDYQRIFANRWGLNVFTNKLTGSGLRVGEIHGGLGLYAGDGATDYHLGLVAGSGKGVGIAGDAKNPFTGNGLFVASNGRVGIGTTSPSAKLHVGGDFRIDGDFKFPNNSKVKFDMGLYYRAYEIQIPDWEVSIGHTSYGYGSSMFHKRFSINAGGDLYCAGSKAGYVVDYFVNRVGDTLEQGDVVVISKYQVSHYSGDKNNIPIPEVDLTDRAYDSRVCGIISKVVTEKDLPCVEVEYGAQAKPMNPEEKKHEEVVPSKHPLREFAAKISEKMDYTKVQDKQIGQMVTMGCFAHCTVDADITPIEMGDLLTTSPTKGHAQKVLEPEKAVGAIIGKALGSLKKGKGKIPILVMLQ